MISINKTTTHGFIFGASAAPNGMNVSARLSLFSDLAPLRGDRFIDLGSGIGSYAIQLVRFCQHLTLVDIDPCNIDSARKLVGTPANIDYVVAPAENTDLPGADNDAAFLIEVLDHVDDPLAAMREAFRLLKPGGRLYISVPNKAFPFETHPIRIGTKYMSPRMAPLLPWIGWIHRRMATARVFSVHDIAHIARRAGFTDIRFDYLAPPFERHPRLRFLSNLMNRTFLRRFGVSICATMVKV